MRVDGTPADAPPSPLNSVILQPVPSSLAAQLGKEYASDKKLLHFLSSLLKVDPAGRYTSAQMLAHPWLEGQKEAHTKERATRRSGSSLDSHNTLAEGDPDESVQAADAVPALTGQVPPP